MKLKNRKTGEIKECVVIAVDSNGYPNEYQVFEKGGSLAELNEEWKDYEEPKTFWAISWAGEPEEYDAKNTPEELKNMAKQINNYFETKEEAEKAMKKLEAWKRLKDKGFRLNAVVDTFFCLDIYMSGEPYEAIKDDLKIVFGYEK